MAEEKTPLHKHEHPVYPWVALIVAMVGILGTAGWYYLSYQTTIDYEADQVIQAAYSTLSREPAQTTLEPVVNAQNIDSSVSSLDKSIGNVSSDDFATSQLDNSKLGVN